MNAPTTAPTTNDTPIPSAPQGQITVSQAPATPAAESIGWKGWLIKVAKVGGLMLGGALIGVAADRTLQARKAEASHQP